MNKRQHRIFICALNAFILLLGIPHPSPGSRLFHKERYTVAVSPDKPPMEMISEDKSIIGFDIDVIHQIADITHMSIKIIPVLRSNLFAGLHDGTYDISVSSITLQDNALATEKSGIEFSIPYLETGDVVVISEDFEEYTGIHDLKEKIVGIKEGSGSKQVFIDTGDITIREYTDIEYAFEALASGKLHAVCVDLPTAAQFVNYNIEYKKIFKIHPDPVTDRSYVIAVKSGNSALLNKINSGIEKMIRDGSLSTLVTKWFFSQ